MILDIFKQNRLRISCTYFILLLEYSVFAIYPWLLGEALDSLLEDRWGNFYWYLGICTTGMIVGTIRRLLDTRAFIKIWGNVAALMTQNMINRGVLSPKIISRTDLIQHYIDFLEFTIPTTASSIIEIVVSSFMIAMAIGLPSAWITLMLVISVVSSYIWSCYIQRAEAKAQDIREGVNHAISEEDSKRIKRGYNNLVPLYVKKSDFDAISWATVDTFSIIAEIILIIHLVSEVASTGTIMYSITYCWKLFTNAGILSYFFVNLKFMNIADRFLKHES